MQFTAANSQFSVFIRQKMQLTVRIMVIRCVMRVRAHTIFNKVKPSMSIPYTVATCLRRQSHI